MSEINMFPGGVPESELDVVPMVTPEPTPEPDPVKDTPVEPVPDKMVSDGVIPAGEVTIVDGDKTDNKAASAEQVSPAVTSANPQDARIWDEEFPGFAGQSGVLPAEMQAQMWRNKALTGTTTTSPEEDQGPGRPKITPLPILDPEAAAKRLEQAVLDNDQEAQIAATAEIAQFARGAVVTLNDYGLRSEYDINKIQAKLDKLEVPEAIRAAGASTPGFEDSDVAAAQSLLNGNPGLDPALAVSYAVNSRLVASKETVPPSAAAEAARKAEALTAASAPESQTTSPTPTFVGSPRVDSPQMKAALLADYKAEQAARKK